MLVRHIHAGPFEGLTKAELPGQLCVFAREVLRAEAAQPLGHYDVVHSHYWLSGQVGALARDRWGVPLVHSMHTMAKVKNAALADGRHPRAGRPDDRRGAGGRGRRHADRQHRPRGQAADRPVRRRPRPRRGRAPRRRPRRSSGRSTAAAARAGLGLPADAHGAAVRRPDPAAEGPRRAAARGRRAARRDARRCARGWSSRWSAAPPAPGWSTPSRWPSWPPSSASTTWCGSCRRWPRPSWPTGTPRPTLVASRRTTSRFGLVAVEAQATGTPVVAAAVGGLTTVVRDGAQRPAGRGPRPARLGRGAAPGARRRRPARRASPRAPLAQARSFGWERTAERTLDVYRARRRARCATTVAWHVGRDATADASARARARSPRSRGWSTTESADGVFTVALPGEKKLQTAVPPRRRRARARRARLRVPQPRREPRGRLPLAARAQPEDVRRGLRRRPASATSTSTRRLPLAAVTPEEIDRLLGSVLDYADESFNTILELGFASSIRKEWEWRISRGEPTRNLEAFRGWLESGDEPGTVGHADRDRRSATAAASRSRPRSGRAGGQAGLRARLAAGHGDADQGERAAGVRHRRRRLGEEDQPSTIVIGGTR